MKLNDTQKADFGVLLAGAVYRLAHYNDSAAIAAAKERLRAAREILDAADGLPVFVPTKLNPVEMAVAKAGLKIDAIKMLRARVTGLGLKEAKDSVEALVPESNTF